MEKKRCLFCSEIVPFEEESGYDLYLGCHCAPKGSYRLESESYAAINAFSYLAKSKQFPIVSAYIRERSELGEVVALSTEKLVEIGNSPTIPITIEQKEARLLQYLYRHSEGPGEPVLIHPLSQSYNLTYSPNLQELVYIIEKLKEARLIIREGMNFKLTEKGWSEAAASIGGGKAKDCFILLAEDVDLRNEWEEVVFPKMEQCGYIPKLFCQTKWGTHNNHSIEQILDGNFIIADLTNHSPEVYFAAGYAISKNMPVTWTIKRSSIDQLSIQSHPIRPFVWDKAEDLAAMLQQKISYKGISL
ncbi:hypothetical protein BK133_13305 [Paenibacillus sp. FSL H8-0548]|uniref:hypothetical protein n=1 Tax=Paenibacillus sp. FSL H8-0548 TaxID=1920422 RepID=UPI00096EDE3E|nr:hypothetical protein [Paenibacillus sp. FSL H8-0548]OMF33763.1 hypothetical protein BK133_13305 [Paenibacillus sp. FSL H8-0548]